MTAIDIDQLRGWVGNEHFCQDAIAPFAAQALAAALNREKLPGSGDALPPAWQWMYFNDCVRNSELGHDGHPKTGGFLPPVPLPRRMWASGEFVCERPLLIGEPAERRTLISAVDLKKGASGNLVFVTLEHDIFQAGRRCLFEKQNLVYREMPQAPAPLPVGERETLIADFRSPFHPDTVMLFRYSALTYNGHRIHYDREYAMQQEHYPGLVVHGPLLATLLVEQIAKHMPGESLSQFRFRAIRPVFDSDRLNLCGRRNGDAIDLWVVNEEGFVTMTATATLGVRL